MLKYYLDKTGKVIKSILFPSSEFVDTEPRKGSMNPVTSGGVAEAVEEGAGAAASNLAPEYSATSTYPAGSYVIHDGVLYTNTNAIETAEDWNPAHWTQTTVAEMMAGAGGSAGYEQRSVNANVTDGVLLVTGVPNRSITVATGLTSSETVPWNIIIDNDCTDAIIILKLPTGYNMIPSVIDIKRVNESSLTLYGTKGQMVSATIEDSGCGNDVIPIFNGIGGDPSSEVIIHICGDTALLSFTVV